MTAVLIRYAVNLISAARYVKYTIAKMFHVKQSGPDCRKNRRKQAMGSVTPLFCRSLPRPKPLELLAEIRIELARPETPLYFA
jgi:hypothetical protein